MEELQPYIRKNENPNIRRLKFCARAIRIINNGIILADVRSEHKILYSIMKDGRVLESFNSLDRLEEYVEETMKHRTCKTKQRIRKMII